jgi:hypothetical protein
MDKDAARFNCVAYDEHGGFYFQSSLYGEICVEAKHIVKPEGILRVYPDMDYWFEQIPASNGKEPDWLRIGCKLIETCYFEGDKYARN